MTALRVNLLVKAVHNEINFISRRQNVQDIVQIHSIFSKGILKNDTYKLT
jgi:hypothetical protein